MKLLNPRNSDSEKWRSDSRIALNHCRVTKIAGDHLLTIPEVFWYLVLLCYWYLSKLSSMLAIWWNTLVMMVYIGSIARPTLPLDQKSFRAHSLKISRPCDDYKSLCIRFLIFSNPPAPRIQIFISLCWSYRIIEISPNSSKNPPPPSDQIGHEVGGVSY